MRGYRSAAERPSLWPSLPTVHFMPMPPPERIRYRRVSVRIVTAGVMPEDPMADDKSKTKEDRKLVAGQETYEVAAFAKKYGIPPSEAGTIIKRYGPSRKKLDAHMASRNA